MASDPLENVQIEFREYPLLMQYLVMLSNSSRFSFLGIVFTGLAVKVKSING